jgi:excisionase family DNA binding protein
LCKNMAEPVQNPFAPFFDEFRRIVREEIAAALQNGNGETPAGEKDWLKAKELAKLYGLPKTWFEERGRAGEIERTKPGRYVLFKRRDVEKYLEEHKQKNSC